MIVIRSKNQHLQLTLPLPTSINNLYINQYGWNPKTKTRIPTGKRIFSKEGEKVKAQIQKQAREQLQLKENQDWDYELTKDNYHYMDAIIYFNRTGRDDNNIYKLNNDALEKIVYENDSRILTRTQRILYDKDNPRIVLTFSPVDYIGIFDSKYELGRFKERCITCNRFDRNCSIFNKSLEGRIQEEIIDNKMCAKFKEKTMKKINI